MFEWLYRPKKLDLSTKRGYDLAAGIRGPDENYPTLKFLITGWIRGRLNVTNYEMSRTVEPTNQQIDRAMGEVLRLYDGDHRAMLHWATHAFVAIEWLLKNGVGERERWFTYLFREMLKFPTKKNRNRVIKCLEDWRWSDEG